MLAIADEVCEPLWGPRAAQLAPDLVVSAGDLPWDYLEFMASSLDVPVLFVPGNHDPQVEDWDPGVPTSRTTDLDTAVDDGILDLPTAWLFGSEAHGLPAELIAAADESVKVPIYGAAESLNLATAAAICLYASASAHRAERGGVGSRSGAAADVGSPNFQ